MLAPRGLDRNTFRIVEGWAYVTCLLDDALGTRIGTRALRRGYGSDLPAYIDAPGDTATVLMLTFDLVMAIDQIRDIETGEPVARLLRAAEASAGRDGQYGLRYVLQYLVDGSERIYPADGSSLWT